MKIETAIELVVLAKGRFLDSPEKYEALHIAKEALEKIKYFQNCKKCGCYDGSEGACGKFGVEVDGDCDGCTFYEDRGEENEI